MKPKKKNDAEDEEQQCKSQRKFSRIKSEKPKPDLLFVPLDSLYHHNFQDSARTGPITVHTTDMLFEPRNFFGKFSRIFENEF